MRFSLRYQAQYRYSAAVFDQHNALRVTPATTPLQRVRGFRVTVEPSARTRSHRDYFGTEVVEFNVPGEHEQLTITAEGEVNTEPQPAPPEGSWDALRPDAYTAAGGEFLLSTGDEPANGALAGLREEIRREDPRATLMAVCDVIPQRFEYSPGATFVGSTVDDLLEGGAGVCQDFVHLALILLRYEGIAARYVSGYLFAAPEDGGADSVEVDTHAWMGGRGPHQPQARRRDAREDRARPLLRRRAADQGRLPRRGHPGRARRRRSHDSPYFIK